MENNLRTLNIHHWLSLPLEVSYFGNDNNVLNLKAILNFSLFEVFKFDECKKIKARVVLRNACLRRNSNACCFLH